ncbi:hypothetical protein ACFCWG_24630 [Streptomyces sp. NPDC056390]|uniref:hypothetical protein n=1 Tax=Streptomyces sp. NPDC056390 TaxID=3345806 RepID=UPI0035E04270
MTTSSQARNTRHLASPIVIVRFPDNIGLKPLTTSEAELAANVERYLQARLPHPLTVIVVDDEQRGTVRDGKRFVTTFQYAPIGAHDFSTRTSRLAVAS